MKKISIIIPVYNAEKYLDRCIQSIVNQTYKNLEIILINDGSIDKSGDICDKWAEKDNRIKVIHQVNSGVSVVRNTGLDSAIGEYITFVDSDDYIELDYCEILYKALERNNVDIAYGDYSTNKHIRNTSKQIKWSSKEYDPVYKTPYFFVWGALYKKDILKNIRFDSDLYVGEDSYFFAQAVKKSSNLVFVDKVLYHYICYPNSALHGTFNSKKYTELESWNRICSLYEDNEQIQTKCRAALAIRCEIMIFKYASDAGFTEDYKRKTIKEYRNNVRFLIKHMFNNHKYKNIVKAIVHCLFPNLWVKYLLVKNK